MKVMTVTWETLVTAREHVVRRCGDLRNLHGVWGCDFNRSYQDLFAMTLITERVKINSSFTFLNLFGVCDNNSI